MLGSVFFWLVFWKCDLFSLSLSPLHSSLLSAHFHLPSHPNRRGLWGIDFSPMLPGETVGSAIAHGARGCWWMGKEARGGSHREFQCGLFSLSHQTLQTGEKASRWYKHSQGREKEKKQRRTSGIMETCDSKKPKRPTPWENKSFPRRRRRSHPGRKTTPCCFEHFALLFMARDN